MQTTAPTALSPARGGWQVPALGPQPGLVPIPSAAGTASPARVPCAAWLPSHAAGSNQGSSTPLTTGVRNGGSVGGCDRCLLHPLLTQGWWLWHRSATVASRFTNGSLVTSHRAKVEAPCASQSSLMIPQHSCKPTTSKEQAQVGWQTNTNPNPLPSLPAPA